MICYRIEVLNWTKYNQKKKRGHESILVSCRFFDDPKIQRLTPHQKLIYLRLLLVCGDFSTGSIEVTSEFISRSTGVPRQMVDGSINLLQELQLVTVEKTSLLKKRKEEKRIEENRKEIKPNLKSVGVPPTISPPKNSVDSEANSKVWEAYRSSYFARYKVDPVRNAKVNSQVSNLVKRLGAENAVLVVKFFLTHNDGFYLKKLHELGLCLADCESLQTQMLRGKAVTGTMVKSYEKASQLQENLRIIDEEGI